MRNSYIITVILSIWIVSCTDNKQEKLASPSEVIREIDKIRLTDLKGQPINLKQYQGKTIFLNLWATWCKPCIQEMPSIKKAQTILQNENIIFLMASNESAEQIEAFSNTHQYKFNYAMIENREEMNVQALPTTFIFNQEGDLVFSETGSRNWDEKNNMNLILKTARKND